MPSKTIGEYIKAAGGKKEVTVRSRTMNVSLAMDVRKRMAEFPGVNWSGVARKAFADLLALLESDSETKET